MSLFISQLAFEEPQHLELAKIGILSGSLGAALIGLVWLLVCTSGRTRIQWKRLCMGTMP
jgi:Na+/H+ antiporter NhaA